MQELIKIKNEDGKQLVSARELYLGLGLNDKNWSRWYPMNIEKNEFFSKNMDWIEVQHDVYGSRHNEENLKGGRPTKDFAISLDFAKHIAMMARTEKSHEYRNYFLECEKALKENVQALNTSELSPELQMFGNLYKAIANQEIEQKKIKAEIQDTKDQLQGIRDVVALTPNAWRKDTSSLISKIAMKLGGFDHIKDVREESYKILNETYKVDINRRLLNKQKNMALEGCSKSKISKINCLDVIAEDEKLINGYLSIISKMAIKYGVDMD